MGGLKLKMMGSKWIELQGVRVIKFPHFIDSINKTLAQKKKQIIDDYLEVRSHTAVKTRNNYLDERT